MTGKEQKKLFAQFSDEEELDSKYRKNFDGYYMIPVGDKYSYNDKIVFIEGSNQFPIIDRIIKVNGENEAVTGFILDEVINYEGQLDSLGYLENYAGERLFEQFTSGDYQTYVEQKRRRDRHSASSASYSDEDEGRTGSAQKDTGTVKHQNRVNNEQSQGYDFNDFEAEFGEEIEDTLAREFETHHEDIGEVLRNTADIEITAAKVNSIVNRIIKNNLGEIDSIFLRQRRSFLCLKSSPNQYLHPYKSSAVYCKSTRRS